MDIAASYQSYIGSLLPDTFLSASQNILLGFFGPMTTGTLTDFSGKITLDEVTTIDGVDYVYKGQGTAQPGIDILGAVIPLGSAVDVLILENALTGDTYFVYPDGTPSILGAVALIIDVSPTGYNFGTNAPFCFVRGTAILTPTGERAVEDLAPGDLVVDTAGDDLRILWTGKIKFPAPVLDWPPIVIEPNALGHETPKRRLKVSAWHRIPLPYGNSAAPLLAPAKALTILPNVHQSRNLRAVQYHHILTERHALILAEGLPAETLLPGLQALDSAGEQGTLEILAALGCTRETLEHHPAARPCGRLLSMKDARNILRSALALAQTQDKSAA